MASGDGLLVRVRPHGGRLTAAQAHGLALLASRHGSGTIDLTSRANLQLRGVTEAAYPALLEGLDQLGLLDASVQAEARRNIVVAPFWTAGDGTCELAQALAEALAAPDAPALPAKFGFAVDLGEQAVLRGVRADVRLERGVGPMLAVRAEGFDSAALVTPRDAVPAALALARWCAATQGVPDRQLPARFQALPAPAPSAAPPAIGPGPWGWLVGCEFGQLHADTLAGLAALGALRLTPWRQVLVEGATRMPALAGLVTRPDDPLMRVAACTGAPGCAQAHAATRPLARQLAAHLPPGARLHVSGCAKGCAHPGTCLTLVATPAGFDLVRHGTAAAPPDLRALSPDRAASLFTSSHAAL